LNIALSSGITVATGSPGTLLPSTPGQGHSPLPASSASPGGGAAAATGSDVQLPPDTLQKIDGLFQILPRIDPLIPLAPHLLTRLQSLATLHEASTTFSNDLKDGEHAIESLKQSESFMKQLLEGLQESMGTNQDVMKSNLEGLQNRIDKVMDRLEKLQ
jgi:nuclear migration protein JNM1